MVWQPGADSVFAVNVTDRYTTSPEPVPDGSARIRFRTLEHAGGGRCAASLRVLDEAGEVLFEATTKDERYDGNDHVSAILPIGANLTVEVAFGGKSLREEFTVEGNEQLVSTAFADSLRAADVERIQGEIWKEHVASVRKESAAAMKARVLVEGTHKMPFWYDVFGEAPEGGRSLWISLHGGGGTRAAVNDQQWENQKRLYSIEEGVYVAPRAPTNTWNLWHEAHIDALFDQLIRNLIVLEGVNPNRVYVLGYSAGGDGVYQLAPRMADRWAAAAMMAGHPNNAQPRSLRNVAFTLHMGAEDGSYNRNGVAAQWKEKLATLKADDPDGYDHWVEIHEGKGHWMDRQDAAALPWMADRSRNLRPDRIVWKQSPRTHKRFYWLAVDAPVANSEVIVEREGQEFRIVSANDVARLTIRLDDAMVDLDSAIVVRQGDKVLFEGVVPRSREVMQATLEERGDPTGVWCAEVTVDLLPEATD
jgi:poly(3-hydroxybutyrate) depolymerase